MKVSCVIHSESMTKCWAIKSHISLKRDAARLSAHPGHIDKIMDGVEDGLNHRATRRSGAVKDDFLSQKFNFLPTPSDLQSYNFGASFENL